jgi:hypothetical protein
MKPTARVIGRGFFGFRVVDLQTPSRLSLTAEGYREGYRHGFLLENLGSLPRPEVEDSLSQSLVRGTYRVETWAMNVITVAYWCTVLIQAVQLAQRERRMTGQRMEGGGGQLAALGSSRCLKRQTNNSIKRHVWSGSDPIVHDKRRI